MLERGHSFVDDDVLLGQPVLCHPVGLNDSLWCHLLENGSTVGGQPTGGLSRPGDPLSKS